MISTFRDTRAEWSVFQKTLDSKVIGSKRYAFYDTLFTKHSLDSKPLMAGPISKNLSSTFNTVLLLILVASIALSLYGCANVVAPTGGPRDEKPPEIKSSSPENGTINYKGKTIELVFDEMIKLDNINSKAIITPNINTANIKYKNNKNRLLIELDSLQDTTTYSFSFPECIKDITENNSQVYQFAFSTGPYLDSISISGTVKSAGGSPIKDGSVALYRGKLDSTILKGKPMYLTKIKDGNYQLNNLKNSTYTQLVWMDDNRNGSWDKGKEKVAFSYPVTADSISNTDYKLYKYDDITPKHSYNQKFNYTTIMNFDEPIMNFKSTPYIPYLINKEQVQLFGTTVSNQLIQFTVQDSSYNILSDTSTIEFKESKIENEFQYSIQPGNLKVFDSIHIQFNKPIRKIQKDSITINSPFTIHYDTLRYKLSIVTASKPDTINMKIARGTFVSLHGDSSMIIKQKLRKANPEDYGSISYKVTSADSSFIIQLVNKTGVVHTVVNKRQYTFVNLEPDSYSFVYYSDTNKNGHWDHGDILNNIQPEKIIFLNKSIVLKANWEIKDHIIDTSEQ